jgi:hypothetical protein
MMNVSSILNDIPKKDISKNEMTKPGPNEQAVSAVHCIRNEPVLLTTYNGHSGSIDVYGGTAAVQYLRGGEAATKRIHTCCD